jgi:hypothetical protein
VQKTNLSIGEILQTREDAIQDLLDHIYEKISGLYLLRECISDDSNLRKEECDILTMESVKTAFAKAPIDLYAGKTKNASDIKCSLSEFCGALLAIKLPFLQAIMDYDGKLLFSDHAECGH